MSNSKSNRFVFLCVFSRCSNVPSFPDVVTQSIFLPTLFRQSRRSGEAGEDSLPAEKLVVSFFGWGACVCWAIFVLAILVRKSIKVEWKISWLLCVSCPNVGKSLDTKALQQIMIWFLSFGWKQYFSQLNLTVCVDCVELFLFFSNLPPPPLDKRLKHSLLFTSFEIIEFTSNERNWTSCLQNKVQLDWNIHKFSHVARLNGNTSIS